MTTREPEFDDIDRSMFDAWLDYRADLHTCGQPLSESLKDPDKPDPDYQVAVEECRACKAYAAFRAEHAEADEALRAKGMDPGSYRIHTVMPMAEVPPEAQEAIFAVRAQKAAQREAARTGQPEGVVTDG